MWILSSPLKESLFIYLPGLIGLLLGYLWPDLDETSLFYGLFASAIIDSGHVYSTIWRTWLHTEERKSSKGYWLVPLIFFLCFSSWYYLQLPGIWTFVVYATLYHHIRQVYGFSKWYQAKNKRSDRTSDYFLYALGIWPMAIYHFRSDVVAGYYTSFDLFIFSNESLLQLALITYAIIIFCWLSYEYLLFTRGIREINRFLSIAFPALMYGMCFVLGKTVTQVLIPLLLMHGISYIGIMAQTLNRTQKRFSTFSLSFLVVSATVISLGLWEGWLENNFLHQRFQPYQDDIYTAIIIGLYLVPLFSHYIFDSWIWKKSHREAQAVFVDAK